MAKNDTQESPETGIVLEDYIPEAPKGEYDDYITAMIDADAKIKESEPDAYNKGKRKAATVISGSRMGTRTINGTETEVDLEVEKTRRLFQTSARNHDRTARLIAETPQGDGSVALKFILGPKQQRPRKTEGDTSTAENSTQDIPQEGTAA